MDYLSMFRILENAQPTPIDEQMHPEDYEPTYNHEPMAASWEESYNGFKSRPTLYNMEGYISPYPSNNWNANSVIINALGDDSRLPPMNDRALDPNKIFNADINALRSLAADQTRVTKMFERKLIEGLSEKGKFGLNENDILAMQALTAARTAVTNINKEQVNIKKNIADLKIKQQQNNARVASAGNGNNPGSDLSGKPASAVDVGRSILDSIFDSSISNASSLPTGQMASANNEYSSTSLDSASSILDDIIPTTSTSIGYEASKPTTYVVVGSLDDDVEYVTYDAEGNEMPDFPNPTARIEKIDREAGIATDELLVEYPLKQKVTD